MVRKEPDNTNEHNSYRGFYNGIKKNFKTHMSKIEDFQLSRNVDGCTGNSAFLIRTPVTMENIG